MALSKFFPFLEECSDKHFENTCLLGSGWFIYSGVKLSSQGSVALRVPWCTAWLPESMFSVGTLEDERL